MFDLSGNVFSLNVAGKSGGAIYYDLFPPFNLKKNLYISNQAKYGQNYASYPFKLKRAFYTTVFSIMYPDLTSNTSGNSTIIGNSADNVNSNNSTQMKRRELEGFTYLNNKKNMEKLVSGGQIPGKIVIGVYD